MTDIPNFQPRRVGDLREALAVTVQQKDEDGVITNVPLTGKTVSFKMINAATGATKIAETQTGVTVTDAANGKCQYDFSASGVDEAGVFLATFIVTDSGEKSSFPVRYNELKVLFDSDTQSGEAAFRAAQAGQ